MRTARRTRRRALLRAVVGAVVAPAAQALSACGLFRPDPPPPADPLTDFYLGTLALAALYDTDQRPLVAPIRAAHKAHVAALAAIMYPPPAAASSTPPPSVAPAQSVREAEQKAWRQAVEACLAAPAERATLLGEIAAARACHLEVLK